MTKNPQIPLVEFSPEARNDNADIRGYTLNESGEKQVDTYLSKLAEGFQRIRVMPGIGRRHDAIPDDLLRVKVEQHYLVYQHAAAQIYIVRILFTRSKLGRYFEE